MDATTRGPDSPPDELLVTPTEADAYLHGLGRRTGISVITATHAVTDLNEPGDNPSGPTLHE